LESRKNETDDCGMVGKQLGQPSLSGEIPNALDGTKKSQKNAKTLKGEKGGAAIPK